MNPNLFPLIPRDTVRAAQAVYGKSNFYLETGDLLSQPFDWVGLDRDSARSRNLTRNQVMLCLITIFQYIETLPDHLVPIAMHERLDWKYALHLPLSYANLSPHSLCELRQQLASNPHEMRFFQALIEWLSRNSPGNPFQNLKADRVIDRVCLFSRVAKIWDAINQALEALAIQQPEWLLDNSRPHWFARYDPICISFNLSADDQDLKTSAQKFGLDGAYLLRTIRESDVPALREIPEVRRLETIWREQFLENERQVEWRQAACTGCGIFNAQGKPAFEPNQNHKGGSIDHNHV